MSLTKIITEPEVKAQLKKLIRRPDFDGERKLLAPPLTKNYMLVGSAGVRIDRVPFRHAAK